MFIFISSGDVNFMTILDTTVRDGSYAVDFKFSCKDVQDLVAKSESSSD